MSDTAFVNGTVIQPAWLNDVNTVAYKNQRSVVEFGANTSSTDNTSAIQNAINAVNSAGGGTVTIPVGTFVYTGIITPKSNVTILGSGWGSILKFTGTTSSPGIWYLPGGNGGITNFHVRNVALDGNRVANPGSISTNLFHFTTNTGEKVTNIVFEGCFMQDAQNNFIYMTPGYTSAVSFNNIVVRNNSFVTTASKRNMGGTATGVAMDAIRVETYNYFGDGTTYGTIIATNLAFSNNYCESIRTGGDFKRGCNGFMITGNRTYNMNDCHHSVDGSFNGVISHNTCLTDAAYTSASASFTNFIEVQGEHIVISNNTGDGGNQVINGIYVTDYGIPIEGSSRGHQSVCVHITNNNLKNVTSTAFKMDNGIDCSIRDNTVENCAAHTAGVASGTTRNASDGTTPLLSIGVKVDGNVGYLCTLGAFVSGACVGAMVGVNPDENGSDFYDINNSTSLLDAGTYANFKNLRGYNNLCPDPFFDTPGGTGSKYWVTSNAVSAVAGSNGAPSGGTVQDPNAGSIQTAISGTATQNLRYSLLQNEYLYFRLDARSSASSGSSKCGVRVKEYNSSNAQIGSDYWYGTNTLTSNYKTFVARHKGQAAGLSYVTVELAPAATFSGDVASTGNTDFSNVRISKTVVGKI